MQQTISWCDDPEETGVHTYSAVLETAYLPRITDWNAVRRGHSKAMV